MNNNQNIENTSVLHKLKIIPQVARQRNLDKIDRVNSKIDAQYDLSCSWLRMKSMTCEFINCNIMHLF